MILLATDWRAEGTYIRYVDKAGKCRAMVKIADGDLKEMIELNQGWCMRYPREEARA